MDNKILRKKTFFVIAVTLVMMFAEIYYGFVTHSMSLLADGFHMGTHALAFAITLLVCFIAIKYEDKTEKFNALGGYTSAILLGFTGLGVIWESVSRFFGPLSITFSDAIFIAVLGLVVNVICILIMGGENPFHNHNHAHSCCEHEHTNHQENLNFKAAYMHILADIMTSVLAIFALITGKYLGWIVLDPVIGVVGGFVIFKWALDLLISSGKILLGFDK